jgi:hypothetical protein
MTLAPLTELEAVNEILSVLGEAPVSALGDPENPVIAEVSAALNALHMVSRSLQNQGYSFNTEHDYTLSPDGDGFIQLPLNVIRADVDPWGPDCIMDVVVRGGRLYNRTDHTFVFTDPIQASLVLLLEFDELPEAARQYIMIKAARKLQDKTLGSRDLHVYTTQDELEAKLDFLSAEADDADFNILFKDPDNFRIIDR